MSESPEIRAADIARRHPVRFGLQFFLGMLGLVQLFERIVDVWSGTASATPVLRLIATGALAAALFTWTMRRQGPPPAAV